MKVRPIGEVNLALGKTAWDSSHENDGLAASFAVDGRRNTRWGSMFNDEEWMVVDLGGVYVLDKVKIFWNTPAYATDYTVATSLTGYDDDFTPMASRTGYVYSSDPDVLEAYGRTGRYVRVTGYKRATGYGTSIDELEVYGTGFISGVEDVTGDDDTSERWFTLQGYFVAHPAAPGIYIRVRGARAEKVLVR